MNYIKHMVTILAACIVTASSIMAQDRIIKKDGEIILAKVISCTDQDIRYFDVITDDDGQVAVNPATTRVLPLDKVRSVILASGRILFQDESTTQPPATASISNPHIYPQYKNPAVAFLLSAVPGAGQFYNDQISKGFAFMIPTALALGLTIGFSQIGLEGWSFFTGTIWLVLDIWQSIDAVVTANNLNIKHGYVVQISPSLQTNTLAAIDGAVGIIPGFKVSLSF